VLDFMMLVVLAIPSSLVLLYAMSHALGRWL
jgi:hypothetical protein